MKKCPECEVRVKDWKGDDAKCAFLNGEFSTENWNCATMNELRDLTDEFRVSNEDQKSALVPGHDPCSFVVLSWYKNRDRTEGAWILTESNIKPLTVEFASKLLAQRKAAKK